MSPKSLIIGAGAGLSASLARALDDTPELAIYNPSARTLSPINEVDPEVVEQAIMVSA